MHGFHVRSARWAIVLAGGGGGQVRELALLENAWERAESVTVSRSMVTVIDRAQRSLLVGRRTPVPGLLIEQPRNLDTAPGIFLALSYVLARDPESTVLVIPSDYSISSTIDTEVKSKTLWSMGWKHLPAMMDGFEALRDVIGLPEEAAVLEVIYDHMIPRSFSGGVFENVNAPS